ncbi:MAG TPA: hypothetical protein VJ044_05625, partial [Candidatus Hodarchaeales archaeon]|nr:hypothetical protein [Candidatus Hodarchaeales archaeon]
MKAKFSLDNFDTIILDCDGVLWEGKKPVEGVKDAIESLIKSGKKIFYVSNNSTGSVQDYIEKFARFGIPSAPPQIMISSRAAAEYLQTLNGMETIYVIGEKGLVDTLTDYGYTVSMGDI